MRIRKTGKNRKQYRQRTVKNIGNEVGQNRVG
jgi:hypothetical protein